VVLWSLVAAILSPLATLDKLFWGIAEWMFQTGWTLLEYLAQWFETIPLWVDLWQLPLLVLASLILLLPKGLHGRSLGLVSLILIISWQPEPLREGSYRLTVLDVGQGLATVVETRDHTLVFDAGPRYSSRFDSGAQIVVPYLRQKRIKCLDQLIISHGDNDHIGGAGAIRKAVQVKEILSSVPQQLVGASACVAPRQWQWNGVKFSLLHPPAATLLRGNNRSCVLLIEGRGGRSLLTGDIEAQAEKLLLEQIPHFPVDIVIAPHHGSKTSSTRAFVARTRPEFVIFSTGYRNRYGFPNPDVLGRYRQQGSKILNTADSGAITFLITPSTALQYAEYRRQHRRYWHFHGVASMRQ
jgi:competence protein ComEC